MRTTLAALVLVGLLAGPAAAAPLFDDVDGFAKPAVENLSRQGVIEGYPDGTYKGTRAATRYEVAQMIARVTALEEKHHAGFATKGELAELQRLVNQLQQELGGLQQRTGTLETQVRSLDARAHR